MLYLLKVRLNNSSDTDVEFVSYHTYVLKGNSAVQKISTQEESRGCCNNVPFIYRLILQVN